MVTQSQGEVGSPEEGPEGEGQGSPCLKGVKRKSGR